MNPLTLEWIAKAEGDYVTMQRESQVKDNPNYDGVCFHAQQCAEKYIKAFLQENGFPVPKIHELPILLENILPSKPEWQKLVPCLSMLSYYAVLFRYPGASATAENAHDAVACCDEIRTVMRGALFSA